jgi:hypothetical protein
LDESLQRLDDLQTGLLRCGKQGVRERQRPAESAERVARFRPKQLLKQRRELLESEPPQIFARAGAAG